MLEPERETSVRGGNLSIQDLQLSGSNVKIPIALASLFSEYYGVTLVPTAQHSNGKRDDEIEACDLHHVEFGDQSASIQQELERYLSSEFQSLRYLISKAHKPQTSLLSKI